MQAIYIRVASVYPLVPGAPDMTPAELQQLEAFFDGYTRRFAAADGRLHPMQQLKVDHSRHVVANAAHIMAGDSWSEADRRLGVACALLHDVGRFSQYAEYGVFEDHRSVNHATRGVEVLRAERVLEPLAPAERETILVAVACHNLRDVGPGIAPEHARYVHLVRDADKLDIFRVLEEAIRDGQLEKHPEVAWSLPIDGRANPQVLQAVCRGETIHYDQLHSLCDFLLVQVGWLRSSLHYDRALALAGARGTLDFREAFIRKIDDSPAVRECFAVTRAAMQARLGP